jgi:hypothetical protein
LIALIVEWWQLRATRISASGRSLGLAEHAGVVDERPEEAGRVETSDA